MENQFNLNTLWGILKKWKRPLFFFILIATIAGGLATLVLPKMYFSSTTIVPANPRLTDKNFLHGPNLLELYSVFGMEEDLDRLLTICKLEGNFNIMVDSFKLIEHYEIAASKKAKEKAAKTLQENISIFKTENGAIKINVWDTDKDKAAALANFLVQLTDERCNTLNQQANAAFLKNREAGLNDKYIQYDSLSATGKTPERFAMEKKNLLNGIEKDLNIISQLQTTLNTKVPGLMILEKAYPATVAGKPKWTYWIALAFFTSLVFGIFVAVILENIRKK